MKLMLASLPGWFPSPPEGRLSAALSPGRSLACHRGRWGRGHDGQGPRRKLNPTQVGQGTLKKRLRVREGRLMHRKSGNGRKSLLPLIKA